VPAKPSRQSVGSVGELAGSLGPAAWQRVCMGWHHHMTRVALVHLTSPPELTLDRVVRWLVSAIGVPRVIGEAAIQLVDDHIHRNRVARKPHMKSWMHKHGNRVEKFIPL
jgi:hypothetical protein